MMGQNFLNVDEVSQALRIRPEVYVRIVTSFAAALGEKIDGLSAGLAAKDPEKMRKILHEIRGTAGNLRLTAIAEPAITLHEAVKAGEPDKKLAEYLEALKKECEELQQGIKGLAAEG